MSKVTGPEAVGSLSDTLGTASAATALVTPQVR
ncbi:MAG: hypothetical protein QOE19_3905, partial [Actinomycetota bacterium]|nr:hypothetical protein [Actinomycetota bacterium]